MLKWESFCLWVIGKMFIVMGFVGIVLAIFYDKIARGIWQEWGRLQFLGFAVFWLIFLAGIWINRFLDKTIREIIEK